MRARIEMIISMLIFGTISVFVRNIALPSSGIAFYRALIAVAVLGVYILIKRIPFGTANKKALIVLAVSGAAMGLNWIFLFESYRLTSVSTATLCYYTAPVIVTVLSPVIFRERTGIVRILCFLATAVGQVLITVQAAMNGNIGGILFGLSAAVLYATVILLNRFIGGVDARARTFYQFAAALIVLLPYTAVGGGLSLSGIGIKGLVSLIILGTVYTAFTYVIYLSAVNRLPGSLTAIFGYIDPLTACLLSVLFFGEPMSLVQAVGGVLILGASAVGAINKRT